MNKALYILVGTTAVGKTAISIPVARALNAEIIYADSMSIYRRMDIGTAKPNIKERAEIPHHLIDICEPWEDFNLQKFLQYAHKTIEQIFAGGRQILVVAGTPLYIKGLVEGVFEGPAADQELRQALLLKSAPELFAELSGC